MRPEAYFGYGSISMPAFFPFATFAPLAVASLAWAGAACAASKTECTCDSPALTVRIPAERAASLVDVALSGPACAGVTVTCDEQSAGGCVVFSFTGRAAGACHVDIDFSAGPPRFSADLRLVAVSCCAGFFADPRSAGDIDVPGASAVADAGSAG